MLLCCTTLSSSRENQRKCSRGSKKDFWHRFYFFYFTLHLYHKNTKNIILSYLSDLTLVSGLIGIGSPYLRWLQGFICFVQVQGTRAQPPTGLIPWFSKTEGNTYATLLHHPFLFKGKPTHAQGVARRISGAIAGEAYPKSSKDLTPTTVRFLAMQPGSLRTSQDIPSTHHKL